MKKKTGLNIIEFPPKSKGLEMEKKIKREKKEKRKFRENITFGSTKSYKLISKIQFNISQTLTILFYCLMGKKLIDFKMRHDASWVRKSNEGGSKKNQKQLNYIHP